jgi:hypothetical protein
MKYLVDANVLSEPTKPAPDARVIDWLRKHESDLAVDSIILGELCIGVQACRGGVRSDDRGPASGGLSSGRGGALAEPIQRALSPLYKSTE